VKVEQKRMSRRWLPAVAVLAVAGGLYAVYSSRSGEAQGEGKPPGPREEVPAITLPRADGGTFSSAALRGKSPLVMIFFATW
jgi:cytochrome oxidase Cu insertion factor (SCO1/SenC/PrrC family)